MIGRAAGATARTAGRSARSAGRAIAAVGPRRLGLAAGAVVLVVAGSIALAGMLGSPERRPTNAAAPTETASPSPIAEEPPGPSPVQTSSPEPATTSGLVVPDVVGLSALEAMRLLESSGLEIVTAEPVPGPPGQVVDTSPRVAELVAPGTPVTLFVGTTPERLQPAS